MPLASPDSAPPLSLDSLQPREPSPELMEANLLILKSETSKFHELTVRIVRAFLIEEVKQMKRLMQQKEKSSKKNKKSKSKGKKK